MKIFSKSNACPIGSSPVILEQIEKNALAGTSSFLQELSRL